MEILQSMFGGLAGSSYRIAFTTSRSSMLLVCDAVDVKGAIEDVLCVFVEVTRANEVCDLASDKRCV